MSVLNRILMKSTSELVNPGFLRMMGAIRENERLPYEERISVQEEALRKLLNYAFANVPYYREMSAVKSIDHREVKSINDLHKLPILSRDDVKNNHDKFRHNLRGKFKNGRTGGSTGKPLQYLISNESNYRGTALQYSAWSRAGYQLGDKLLVFAGGSLVARPDMRYRLISFTRNSHSEKAFSITDEKLNRLCEYIVSQKPLYIRGYASSVTALAEYFLTNEYKNSSVQAVFTTSEPLLPYQRKTIKDSFCASVYDNYGLNDGGVSAYECSAHNGMHIDTYRAIMEICDDEGNPVPYGVEGHIIATDLYNYAFPFIRYDTGDMGIADNSECECGNTAPRLLKIMGRAADVLTFEKHKIAGSGITVLMGKTATDYYQVIQKDLRNVEIKLLLQQKSAAEFEQSISTIKQFFADNAPEAILDIRVYDNIKRFPLPNNKHKFIVNQLLGNDSSSIDK